MTIGVNQTSAPIKFCFLIEPDSEEKFERAIKIAFSFWGGIYSPILPLYKIIPQTFIVEYDIKLDTKNYYCNTINNYDPDIILFDGTLEEEYIKTLIGDRKLLTIESFLEDTIKGENSYGVNAAYLISHIVQNEFKFKRNDELKLLIPNTQNSSLFIKSFLGCLIDSFQEKLRSQLKTFSYFEEPEIDINNIAAFFPNNNITTLDINTQQIGSFPERHWFRGESIYFLNETRLNDVVNFWNLRALGWHIIPIPINRIDDAYFSNYLERFTQHQLKKNRDFILIDYQFSSTTTLDQKSQIEEKLRNLKIKIVGEYSFAFQEWFPRFWEERSILEADKALCENVQINSTYSQIEIKDNLVKFKANNLSFNLKDAYRSTISHKVDLTFNYFDEYLENAGLIYGIETIDWIRLTHSFSSNKWRLSKSGLSYFINREDDEVHFYIPKAKDFFNVYFRKHNNKLNETANGQLANEVLKNIGGIVGTHFLQNKSSLKILELVEDGRIVMHLELIAEIKKSLKTKNNDRVESYIKRLLDNKIIEFGSILQCDICHQRTFYLPTEIQEIMICSVCRNKFDLPMHKPNDIKWSYRGIGPFSKNNKVGGIMAVFLTLKLFGEEFSDTSGNMSALIGFELSKNTKIKEVDLVILLQEKYKNSIPPDLVFCECKTFRNFTSKDADRMIELGDEFPNSILTFATLNDQLLDEERTEILRVVTHFRRGVGTRPINPVLILTAKELLPNNSFDHFSDYQDESKAYHRYNDWIGSLCEFSVKKHLQIKTWGEIRSELWQKEMEKRNEKNTTQENSSEIQHDIIL